MFFGDRTIFVSCLTLIMLMLIHSSTSHLRHESMCTLQEGIDNTVTRQCERETQNTRIFGPHGWKENSRIMKLALVMDSRSIFNKSQQNKFEIIDRYKEITLALNSLFQQLNVFIALVHLDIWTNNNQDNSSKSVDNTKANFKRISEKLLENEYIDNVQFISNNDFMLATPNVMCTMESYGVNNDELENGIYFLAFAIARNMGITENYGNCTDFFSNRRLKHLKWSSCVFEQMVSIEKNETMLHCLKNKPVKIFDEPVCGNGFLESGEECDCGLVESCGCCDVKSCMIIPNVPCLMGL